MISFKEDSLVELAEIFWEMGRERGGKAGCLQQSWLDCCVTCCRAGHACAGPPRACLNSDPCLLLLGLCMEQCCVPWLGSGSPALWLNVLSYLQEECGQGPHSGPNRFCAAIVSHVILFMLIYVLLSNFWVHLDCEPKLFAAGCICGAVCCCSLGRKICFKVSAIKSSTRSWKCSFCAYPKVWDCSLLSQTIAGGFICSGMAFHEGFMEWAPHNGSAPTVCLSCEGQEDKAE